MKPVLGLAAILYLPAAVRGKWGDWDSVSCYTCGLPNIDPETDQEGSYGIDPGEDKKMYNHSCDLMDSGMAGQYKYAGQTLLPREWYDVLHKSEPLVYDNGTAATTCTPPVLAENGTVITEESCTPIMREWEEKIPKPPKDYDMSMWIRKCPKGVRSCFKAVGNWDGQKPVFRGCSQATYSHGTTCQRALQRVQVHPGRPMVDVELFLCYCSSNTCNKDITAGAVPNCPVSSLLMTAVFCFVFSLFLEE